MGSVDTETEIKCPKCKKMINRDRAAKNKYVCYECGYYFRVKTHNRIRMVDKFAELKKTDQFGKYVSLLPFTPEVRGITLKGFAYEVEDFTLVSGIARGVSNELKAETATISCEEGILLVIESRD